MSCVQRSDLLGRMDNPNPFLLKYLISSTSLLNGNGCLSGRFTSPIAYQVINGIATIEQTRNFFFSILISTSRPYTVIQLHGIKTARHCTVYLHSNAQVRLQAKPYKCNLRFFTGGWHCPLKYFCPVDSCPNFISHLSPFVMLYLVFRNICMLDH